MTDSHGRPAPVGGPGRFVEDHPFWYHTWVGAAAAVAVYAGVRAVRPATRVRRAGWLALAALEAAIAAGIVREHDHYRHWLGRTWV